MAVCRTHAVVVLSDVHEHWFPRVSRTTVRSLIPSKGRQPWAPHHQDGVRDYVYVRHRMRAVDKG